MTMPHLTNCKHQGEGWCLDCVRQLYETFVPEQRARSASAINAIMRTLAGRGYTLEYAKQLTVGQIIELQKGEGQ